jgi:kinesin family protein 6/9
MSKKFLTLEEKVKLIELNDKEKQSSRKLADLFGCGKTQVSNILKRKAEIMEEYKSCANKNKKIKIDSTNKIEELTIKWFNENRKKGIPINGPMILEAAQKIASGLSLEFKTSNWWLERFKKTYNISFKKISGEVSKIDKKRCG